MRFIAQNLLIRSTKRLLTVLPHALRRRAAVVFVLLLGGTFLELFGLAALVPLFSAVLEGDATQMGFLKDLHVLLGSPSESEFILILSACVFALITLKNVAALFILRAQSRFSYAVYEHFAAAMHFLLYSQSMQEVRERSSAILLRDINGVPIRFASRIVLAVIQLWTEVAVLLLIVAGVIAFAPTAALLLAATLLPALALFYSAVRRKARALGLRSFEVSALLNKHVHDSVFGYEDVRLCGREQWFHDAFRSDAHEWGDIASQQHVLNMTPTRVLEVAMVLAICVLVTYGGYLEQERGSLSLLLGVFALAAYRTLPSCNRIMASILSIRGAEHMFDVIERARGIDPTAPILDDDGTPLRFERRILLKDLGFKYSGTDEATLDGLNIEIRKGECVGVIGSSGAGKTTLLHVLLRFLTETSGQVLVDDAVLSEGNVGAWRRLIGYVSQDVFILDGTIAENVAIGRESIDGTRLARALRLARLDDFVAATPEGVDLQLGERGARLSGGQRQRIAIARALYSGATVLFLDEATSALDAQTEREITESLQTLTREGITIVIVAHRLSTLRNCSRVLELASGGVRSEKTYEAVVGEAQQADAAADLAP